MDIKDVVKDVNEVYQKGLDDAWNCAREIIYDRFSGGMSTDDLDCIFGDYENRSCILRYFSASEAIEKIKEYEEKKKAEEEIKVGDEVVVQHRTFKAVVSGIDGDLCCIVLSNGKTQHTWKSTVRKTGRHFDQIAEVLEQMKEDNDAYSN